VHKVSRSQFYLYKRDLQEHDFDGLVDKPPIPASHPSQRHEKTQKLLTELPLEPPAFGQQQIETQLDIEGLLASATSVSWLSPASSRGHMVPGVAARMAESGIIG
jgi:hypothetical protein